MQRLEKRQNDRVIATAPDDPAILKRSSSGQQAGVGMTRVASAPSAGRPSRVERFQHTIAASQPGNNNSGVPQIPGDATNEGFMAEQSDSDGNGAAAGSEQDSTQEPHFGGPRPGGEKRTVSQVLGEIVWVLSQSPAHKNFFLADLEWLVMTPIVLEQFRIFYGKDRPIGIALWAYVSDDVEKRLSQGGARLAPADWKSGANLWLVDLIAPFGGQDIMLKDLKEKVFKERPFKFRGPAGVKSV